MSYSNQKLVTEYLLAMGATLIALGIRVALDPFLGNHFPYMTFFLAIATAAFCCGMWPSIMAVALSGVAANWFFMPPRYSFQLTNMPKLAGVVTFLLVSLALVCFGQALQRARRRAEIALLTLSEREVRLGVAMEGASLGAWEVDLTTGLNVWDERIPLLLGVPSERAVEAALTWADNIHPEDRPRVIKEFHAAVDTGTKYETEFRVIRTDGAIRWFLSMGKIVMSPDGGSRRMVGVVQDITDRKLTTNILKESEERLRLAAEGAKLGLWFWEISKNELVWTGRCKQMFGLAPDAAVTYERFLECLHPDDRQRTHDAVMQSHRERGALRH